MLWLLGGRRSMTCRQSRMIWNAPMRCSSGLWDRHGRNSLTSWIPGRFRILLRRRSSTIAKLNRVLRTGRNWPSSFLMPYVTKWLRNLPKQWLRRIDTAQNCRRNAAYYRLTPNSAWPLCCRTAHCHSILQTTTASWPTVAVHRAPITVMPYCPSMTVGRSCTGISWNSIAIRRETSSNHAACCTSTTTVSMKPATQLCRNVTPSTRANPPSRIWSRQSRNSPTPTSAT